MNHHRTVKLFFTDFEGKKHSEIKTPKKSATIVLSSRGSKFSDLWVRTTGWTTKGERYKYDVKKNNFIREELSTITEYPEFENFEIEELMVKSYDGVEVPLSLIYKKGIKKDKTEEKDSFLKTQQKELFQFTRDAAAKKQWNVAKAKAVKSDFAKEYFYGKDNFYNLKADPNGNFATFSLAEESDNKKEKMEVFITSDGYNQSPETKDKVSVNKLK